MYIIIACCQNVIVPFVCWGANIACPQYARFFCNSCTGRQLFDVNPMLDLHQFLWKHIYLLLTRFLKEHCLVCTQQCFLVNFLITPDSGRIIIEIHLYYSDWNMFSNLVGILAAQDVYYFIMITRDLWGPFHKAQVTLHLPCLPIS